MNDDRTLERAARSWLDAGPTEAPDRAVDAALARIQTTRQERDVPIPWRLPTMNPGLRLAGTAVLVIAVVGAALVMLRPDSSVGPGVPTPSPTALATPTTTANLGACRLITSAEAAQMAGDPGLGALPTQSGAGDVTSCLYSDGGGDTVLRVTQYRAGAAGAMQAFAGRSGVVAVADLGTEAAFDPAMGELLVRKDDLAILLRAPKHQGEAGLAALREVAVLALLRL